VNLDQFPPPGKPTTRLFDGVSAMERNSQVLGAFAALCEKAEPELIVMEEVWLWPAVRRLAMVASNHVPLIYNSYSIQAPLFQRLLVRAGHDHAESLAAELSELEADLARNACGCSAVTEEDAATLRAFGARRVVVAPNGVEHRERAYLAGALPEALSPEQHYVLYVASGHPHNASGVPELFTAILKALRPLERLVVAGSVCDLLGDWLKNGGPAYMANGRLVLLGQVTDLCLDGLIANAAGLVLPLRDGGGSNLKTAEALYSGLPVVATTAAMRGYEAFRGLDGLIVVDGAAAFAAAMRYMLESQSPRRVHGSGLEGLLWVNSLRPIVRLVDEVLSAVPPADR
jgi:glycosyltransferase involved in cell wall biosynthesis